MNEGRPSTPSILEMSEACRVGGKGRVNEGKPGRPSILACRRGGGDGGLLLQRREGTSVRGS